MSVFKSCVNRFGMNLILQAKTQIGSVPGPGAYNLEVETSKGSGRQ